MGDHDLRLLVGGCTRRELREALAEGGVRCNAYAETLLEHGCFDGHSAQSVVVIQRTVGELGLRSGGSLSQILAAAQNQGLLLCPPDTGPYLRLAMTDQEQAPDSVLSAGRAPTGAVHVASAPLREDDDEYPKGFYLRVVDGVSWLRGFRCADEYRHPSESTFAFCRPNAATVVDESGVRSS